MKEGEEKVRFHVLVGVTEQQDKFYRAVTSAMEMIMKTRGNMLVQERREEERINDDNN